MATQTYTPSTNTDPTKAIFGEKSSAVSALQTQLNTQNATNPNYVPLKVDGLYGPMTQAATLIKAPVTTVTDPIQTPPATNPNNPIGSSTTTRADNASLEQTIKDLKDQNDAATKLLQDRQTALQLQRTAEISGIEASSKEAERIQKERQDKEYAGTSTNLVGAGGGFLGFNSTQSGVLQNLQHTYDNEHSALLAKKNEAIQAASNAYAEKDFALARDLIKQANDTESEIYKRKQDFNDNALALAREDRAQQEFDNGINEKKITAYSTMDDATFAKLTPDQIAQTDKGFYSGYTVAKRAAEKAAAEGKTEKNNLDFANSLQTLINKTPAGQKFTIGDKTYVGMKKEGAGSTSGMISPNLAIQLGVPSLAGKNESDIILSLAFDKPPKWYEEFYKTSAPQAYEQIKNNPELLKTDWNIFKNQPDIQAYSNSSVVTKRIEGADANANAKALQDAQAVFGLTEEQ